MMLQKTFKYRLEPTNIQKDKLAQFAGSVRFVYNHGLALIKQALATKSKLPSYADLANLLPWMKRTEETAWLAEVHSQILQQALKDLEQALKAFWRRRAKKDAKPGFPGFRCKGKHDTFRYPQGFKHQEERVFLPKIGWVRHRNSRAIEGIVKQVTVKKEATGWFIAVTCSVEQEVHVVPITPVKAVGIDVGLTHFATTSQGVKIANPRYLKHDLVRLRHQQRLLSGKVKGSKNRKKQVQRVVALHQKIKNKRKDFTHKQSTQFVKNHDVVAVENLHFVSIDRFKPTSQICSSCGNRQPMPLSNRIFNCQDCGLEQDRDINASLNIRSAGLAVLNACGGYDSGRPSEAGISSF